MKSSVASPSVRFQKLLVNLKDQIQHLTCTHVGTEYEISILSQTAAGNHFIRELSPEPME